MTEYCCKKHWLEKRVKGLEDQLAELKAADKMWEIMTLMPHTGSNLNEPLENAINLAIRHPLCTVTLIFNGVPIAVQDYDGEVSTTTFSAEILRENYEKKLQELKLLRKRT